VTVLFLGSVEPARVGGLRIALDRVAGSESCFEVETGPGAGRARGRDGVAWLGIRRGSEQVERISHALDAEMALGTGAPPLQGRHAAAHLTIARHANVPLIEALARSAAGPLDVSWTARELVLYRSFPTPAGSVYEALHSALLHATDPAASP
jgi:2'-5' RNA ligase